MNIKSYGYIKEGGIHLPILYTMENGKNVSPTQLMQNMQAIGEEVNVIFIKLSPKHTYPIFISKVKGLPIHMTGIPGKEIPPAKEILDIGEIIAKNVENRGMSVEDYAMLENTFGGTVNIIKSAEEIISNTRKELSATQSSYTNIVKERDTLSRQASELQTKLSNVAKTDTQGLEVEIQRLKTLLEEERNKPTEVVEDKTEEINALKNEINELKLEIAKSEFSETDGLDEVNELKAQIETLKEQREILTSRVSNLKTENSEIIDNINKTHADEIQTLKQKINEQELNLEEERLIASKLRTEIEELKNTTQEINQTEQQNDVKVEDTTEPELQGNIETAVTHNTPTEEDIQKAKDSYSELGVEVTSVNDGVTLPTEVVEEPKEEPTTEVVEEPKEEPTTEVVEEPKIEEPTTEVVEEPTTGPKAEEDSEGVNLSWGTSEEPKAEEPKTEEPKMEQAQTEPKMNNQEEMFGNLTISEANAIVDKASEDFIRGRNYNIVPKESFALSEEELVTSIQTIAQIGLDFMPADRKEVKILNAIESHLNKEGLPELNINRFINKFMGYDELKLLHTMLRISIKPEYANEVLKQGETALFGGLPYQYYLLVLAVIENSDTEYVGRIPMNISADELDKYKAGIELNEKINNALIRAIAYTGKTNSVDEDDGDTIQDEDPSNEEFKTIHVDVSLEILNKGKTGIGMYYRDFASDNIPKLGHLGVHQLLFHITNTVKEPVVNGNTSVFREYTKFNNFFIKATVDGFELYDSQYREISKEIVGLIKYKLYFEKIGYRKEEDPQAFKNDPQYNYDVQLKTIQAYYPDIVEALQLDNYKPILTEKIKCKIVELITPGIVINARNRVLPIKDPFLIIAENLNEDATVSERYIAIPTAGDFLPEIGKFFELDEQLQVIKLQERESKNFPIQDLIRYKISDKQLEDWGERGVKKTQVPLRMMGLGDKTTPNDYMSSALLQLRRFYPDLYIPKTIESGIEATNAKLHIEEAKKIYELKQIINKAREEKEKNS